MKRDAAAEFAAARIPGAAFFDIDGIADAATPLPHMLPSEGQFGAAMDALGIVPGDTVVVYDRMGVFSAARAWWTLRAFGHEAAHVLDGGFSAWQAAGLPVDAAPPADGAATAGAAAARDAAAAAAPRYRAKLRRDRVRGLPEMLALAASREEQVVDARSEGRFSGADPEPRPAKHAGHIPGARCVPFPSVLDSGRRGAGARGRRCMQTRLPLRGGAGLPPPAATAAAALGQVGTQLGRQLGRCTRGCCC